MMVQINIDTGENLGDISSVKTMNELVELVKSTIDPLRMISGITLNGQIIKESDWRLPLSIHGNGVLGFETCSREEFLNERIKGAPEILDKISANLKDVSGKFRSGDSMGGNESFAGSIADLEAFVKWYMAVIEVDPSISPSYLDSFSSLMDEMSEVCERMVRNMMTAKWSEVAGSIDLELIPKLEKIRVKAAEFAQSYTPH